MTRSLFALFTLGLFASAHAASAHAASASGTGIAIVTGMPTGIGLEITQGLNPSFNVRLGAGLPAEATATDVKLGSNKYDVDFKFGGVNAFVDWHPWKGNFRVSGGVITLRNDLAFDRTKSPYVLDGVSYSSADLTSLRGLAHLDRTVAPAFLIGWGNAVKAGRKVGFQFEIGAAWAGDATTILTATGPKATDPVLLKNLQAEASNVNGDSKGMLTGILRLGVTFHF